MSHSTAKGEVPSTLGHKSPALQFIELSGQQERRDHGSIGREECEEIAQMKRNNDEATNVYLCAS